MPDLLCRDQQCEGLPAHMAQVQREALLKKGVL